MRRTTIRERAVLVGALLPLLLASCGGADEKDDEPGASGDESVTTLRMAATGSFADSQINHLLQAIEAQSGGALRAELDPEWDITGTDADVEQQIVAAVASGELDLGWVGTRAFEELGVTSLRALTAPLLVDSYALQAAILDTDLPDRMLEGLAELDIVGLGVMGGALRKPGSVEGYLLGPDDYAGVTLHAWHSDGNEATIEALGATHSGIAPVDRDTGLLDGTIGAYENSLHNLSYSPRPLHITANVSLWPATGVLVANPDTLDGLSETQAAWLRDAVSDTAAKSVELANGDAELVEKICAQGGRFGEASKDDLAALGAAVEPIYAKLAEDTDTAGFLSEIETLKKSVTAERLEIPDGCTGRAPDAEPVVIEGTGDPSVLNGSYRVAWGADELFEALDVPPEFEAEAQKDAENNAGVVNLSFEDGTFSFEWESGPFAGERCSGTYAVDQNRVTMGATVDAAEWDCGTDSLGAMIVDAAWKRQDGELILSDFRVSDEPDATWWFRVYFGHKPLVEIGA